LSIRTRLSQFKLVSIYLFETSSIINGQTSLHYFAASRHPLSMSDHRKVIAIHYASGIDKSAKQPSDGDGDSNEPSVGKD